MQKQIGTFRYTETNYPGVRVHSIETQGGLREKEHRSILRLVQITKTNVMEGTTPVRWREKRKMLGLGCVCVLSPVASTIHTSYFFDFSSLN